MSSSISAVTSQTNAALTAAKSKMSAEQLAKAAKTSIDAKDMAKINKTAEDFEAVFVTEMIKPMMNMVKVDDEFGGGKGEEVFRDMITNEYGKKITSQGGFGIATHVKEQLIRMQEQSSNPHANPEVIAAAVRDAMTQKTPNMASLGN